MSKLYVLNGPEIGESFNIREGVTFLGRSLDNDIRINDKTLSRKHLKILKLGDKCFITDLKSRNGTFFDGNFIGAGVETEVKEGLPIALGVTVICLGTGCEEQIMPSLDSVDLINETSGHFLKNKDRSTLRKLEFLLKVSDVLTEDLSYQILEKIIVHIFDLFKRVDRVLFVLIDPETEEITKIIYNSRKPGNEAAITYCEDIVNRVIESGRPVVISDAKTEDSEFADTLEVLKIESVMCLPLICHSQILGVIYVDSLERPYGFRREDLYLLLNLTQRIAPAIEDIRFASEIIEVIEDLSSDT
jgi:adenylate cyclase